MSEEKKEFTVKDRRFFSEEKTESEVSQDAPPTKDAEDPPSEKAGKDEIKGKRSAEEEVKLPEINFPTFIISLNASALFHLGVIADPATGEKEKNLGLAKQVIDTLSMLADKTKGNLTSDEESMLKNILYDLRIIYVKEKS
jgi:hypothetical protein